ncbi:MAG: LruC domain-containing protein [Flavobacteriia bacterium]|nr:LruC domain-containing protein [Flavobacteriia bacterium]
MKRLSILIVAVLLIACEKNIIEEPTPSDQSPLTMENMDVANGFNYETSSLVGGSIQVLDLDDNPMENVRISLYDKRPDEGGKVLFQGLTDNSGQFTPGFTLPRHIERVAVVCHAMGFPNLKVVEVRSGNLIATFGGSSFKALNGTGKGENFKTITSAGANCFYISTYNSQGVPANFEPVNDVVDQSFLDMVNYSLPEQAPVPVANPHYLATGNSTDIDISANADVWITFVHEGAGYRNALGYFTYPTNNPPTSTAAIDSIFILLPNASFQNSGGGLYSGNKIRLGQFGPNTSIGWVIFQNAWDGSGVNVNRQKFYSNPDFNPESTAARRQHNVQLFDNSRDVILIGFEDLNRDGGSDEDFNDLIYYVTANPITAVSTINLPTTTEVAPDSDLDGVVNTGDDYPFDANKAFDNWAYGTLAFEDMWPLKGDYDFNDLVAGYAFNQVTNANGLVVEINMDLEIRAIGAANTNALGFVLGDALSSDIGSINGQFLNGNVVNTSGGEDGQTNAAFIAIDDMYEFLGRPEGAFFNTLDFKPAEAYDSLSIQITMANPVSPSVLGPVPFNAFIVPGGVSGGGARTEIHMANYPPSDLMSGDEFGNADDDSNANQGRWYKTETNLPWAINVASTQYDHVKEFEPIIDAYLHFAAWAESAGLQYSDWYQPNAGYRNSSKIFGN